MKKKVYIETTIPSFYYNERTEPENIACCQWTREWWDFRRHDYDCCTSEAVFEELNDGRNSLRREKLSLLADLRTIEITELVLETAEIYVARYVMPQDPGGDALHLALASHYRCDILLTWNCKHLANETKIEHITRVNALLNLHTPRMITPLGLLGGPKLDERESDN